MLLHKHPIFEAMQEPAWAARFPTTETPVLPVGQIYVDSHLKLCKLVDVAWHVSMYDSSNILLNEGCELPKLNQTLQNTDINTNVCLWGHPHSGCIHEKHTHDMDADMFMHTPVSRDVCVCDTQSVQMQIRTQVYGVPHCMYIHTDALLFQ